MGEPFREAGWDVTDVDWDGRFKPEIVTDITKWDYKNAFKPGRFDVVWASPDCRMYSRHAQPEGHGILRAAIAWSRHAAILLTIYNRIDGLLKILILGY